MKTKESTLILLLLAGVVIYVATKKRKGSIEIGPLDQGEFLPDDRDAAEDLTDDEKIMFEI
jgi:hypothetical protein